MKGIIAVAIIGVLGLMGYMAGTRTSGSENDVAAQQGGQNAGGTEVGGREGRGGNTESRVRGRVMSISDTEIIVGTFAQQQGRGDRGGERGQAQDLSEEERAALRAEREAERAAQGEPEITGEKVIMITDETIVSKGQGGFGGGQRGRGGAGNDASGAQAQEPETVERSEITEGAIVSITLDEAQEKAVNIFLQEVQ